MVCFVLWSIFLACLLSILFWDFRHDFHSFLQNVLHYTSFIPHFCDFSQKFSNTENLGLGLNQLCHIWIQSAVHNIFNQLLHTMLSTAASSSYKRTMLSGSCRSEGAATIITLSDLGETVNPLSWSEHDLNHVDRSLARSHNINWWRQGRIMANRENLCFLLNM